MSLANMHDMLVQHRTHMLCSMLLEHLGTFGKDCLPLQNRCMQRLPIWHKKCIKLGKVLSFMIVGETS